MKTILGLVCTLTVAASSATFAQRTAVIHPGVVIKADDNVVSVQGGGGSGGAGYGTAHAATVGTGGYGGTVGVGGHGGGSGGGSYSVQISGGGFNADEICRQVEEAMHSAMKHADASVLAAQEEAVKRVQELLKASRNLAGKSTVIAKSVGGRSTGAEAPALLVTRAMGTNVRAEWQEDLRVMDKLLRDEVKRVEGEAGRQALGIRLWFGSQSQPAPMYIEDSGAIFSYAVNFPLATAKKTTSSKEPKSGSAWDRAKSEIDTTVSTNADGYITLSRHTFAWSPQPVAEYDSVRVEALQDALITILSEAKNIRHLGSKEHVIVTVAGTDDTGTPVRLTLKAKKSDIDDFAAGKLKLDAFRGKLAKSLE